MITLYAAFEYLCQECGVNKFLKSNITNGLKPAFEWICPNCKTDQFLSAVIPDIGPDGKDNILGADCAIWCPQFVTCKNCGEEFETNEEVENFSPE